MGEESTTANREQAAHAVLEAVVRRDFDAAAAMYAPDAVWDASAQQGVGVFEGREAIRRVFEDWIRPYAEFQGEFEEFHALGNGVTLGVLVQRGRLGDSGWVAFRDCHVTIWRDELIAQNTVYADIEEGRAVAERLSKERS